MYAKKFYVSIEGNDAWSGLLPSPNNDCNDGPFRSLERARDAVRQLDKEDPKLKGGVEIVLRGGDYYLREPFTLAKKDSGTKYCPIRYSAFQGETPRILGSIQLSGWQEYKDGIYKTTSEALKFGRIKSRLLYLNGEIMTRARWPKVDPDNPLYSGWAMTEEGYEPGYSTNYSYEVIERKHTTVFKYAEGAFRNSWKKPWLGEVNYYNGTGGWKSIVPIKSIDEKNRLIELQHGGYQFDCLDFNFCFKKNCRYYVDNLLEELSEPGEWCLDFEEGVVYFMPPKGVDLFTSTVTIPVLDTLIEMRGVEWTEFSGITFSQTLDGDNIHKTGVEDGGVMASIAGDKIIGDAIFMRDTRRCTIRKNHFDRLGGNAIYMRGFNCNTLIQGNEISYCGATGVCLAGSKRQFPRQNEVCDNYIHHCGRINKGVAGVLLTMSSGNIIHHNRIEYMPHHAINLSDNPHGKNIIEYNEIHFVCQENEDNGAINCWMENSEADKQKCGHIIRYNLITDIYSCEVIDGKLGPAQTSPVFGVYLDNYTSNCVVYGNILVRCGHAGIRIHAGKNNIMENNIVVDCRYAIEFADWICWPHMSGFMTDNWIMHNIFAHEDSGSGVYALNAWTENVIAMADNNLIFNRSGEYFVMHEANYQDYKLVRAKDIPKDQLIDNLQKWNDEGYDRSSLIADPLFVAPDNDNYELQDNSPAYKIGFKPIDVKNIGIRNH